MIPCLAPNRHWRYIYNGSVTYLTLITNFTLIRRHKRQAGWCFYRSYAQEGHTKLPSTLIWKNNNHNSCLIRKLHSVKITDHYEFFYDAWGHPIWGKFWCMRHMPTSPLNGPQHMCTDNGMWGWWPLTASLYPALIDPLDAPNCRQSGAMWVGKAPQKLVIQLRRGLLVPIQLL